MEKRVILRFMITGLRHTTIQEGGIIVNCGMLAQLQELEFLQHHGQKPVGENISILQLDIIQRVKLFK